jgi:hypothetical protein
MRGAGVPLCPTFIPFTPWTTRQSYVTFLREIARLGMVAQVAPIQLAIRLLIPEGSRLLELGEVRQQIGTFDARSLCYPWRNPDESVDRLCAEIQELIKREEKRRAPRMEIFHRICDLAGAGELPEVVLPSRATIPYLTEPWYC